MGSMNWTALMNEMLGPMCDMPSCQWGPPLTGTCSTAVFFHPTDATGLVTGAEKDQALDNMCNEKLSGWWAQRKSLLPSSFDCKERKAKFARTFFTAGMTDVDSETEYNGFEKEYMLGRTGFYPNMQRHEREVERKSKGDLRVILYSSVTIMSQFLDVLMVDGLLSVGSLVMVWAYMWWTLESFFLASCAMFEIVFSVPVAFTIWVVIFGQQIIWTQCLCVYLILGIGADDAFILYDAWVQAQHEAPDDALQHWTSRFAYAYRRSFNAMAITTATTCCSFLIGSASPLPQVQKFSIFAGIVVFVDWIFCETFFASAVIVFERYFRSEKREPGQCCGAGCCWGCCRCTAKALCGDRCVQPAPKKGEAPPKRGMERFCEGPLFNVLHKYKFAWLGFWGMVIVASAVSAGAQLRTATKRAPLGRQDLDVIRGLEILIDEFTYGGAPSISFVYGIDTEQPMLKWDPDGNEAQWSAIGKLTKPEGQVQLLDMMAAADNGKDEYNTRCATKDCLVLGRSLAEECKPEPLAWQTKGFVMPNDIMCAAGRYCFMEEVADYWAWNQNDCPGKLAGNVCSAAGCLWSEANTVCYSPLTRKDFVGLPEKEFLALLKSEHYTTWRAARVEYLRDAGRNYDSENFKTETGYRFKADKPNELQMAYCSFNGTIPRTNTVEEANEWFRRWEDFRTRHGKELGGYQTAEVYDFMVTQNEMVKAAVLGIVLSTLVTFIVLVISTGNWRVSSLGLVCIIGVSIVVLGIMPLMDWQLGESECIFIIAVVGLSVDYTVHLLHSYKSPKYDNREERSKHALAEMGISVANSAITTLLAAAMLFACGFYFFFQFGAFIFFVIGFSIVMSMTFLIPLLLVLGPQGDGGKVHILYKLPCWRGKDRF
jgi:preprotein translocase subunit SecF